MDEQIEILDEDFLETDSNKKTNLIKENSSNQVISLDRLFNENEEVIDAYEDDKQKEELLQKKITKIQIGLIVFLIVFASLVYFFGYNFLEPYIKID